MKDTDVTLIHGDCFDIIPTLEFKQVSLFFLDLPYGITKNANPWDQRLDLSALWRAMAGIAADNAVYIFTATQPFASAIICSQQSKFRYDLIWSKRPVGALNAKRQPMREHEHILIFGTPKSTYTPQMSERKTPRLVGKKNGKSSNFIQPNRESIGPRLLTHKHPTSLQRFLQDNSGHHPTQKPVALLEYLIKTYSKDGDTILDPTAGSGTAALAAMNVGKRSVICIEKDSEYFAKMKDRIAGHRKDFMRSTHQ
jgi:site-specific DNA-methyltransferase (adenine-specific)